ncbi:conserved hypothetical protein [Planktothrix serta PCC 8927]|uniref:FIST N domain protein n=1 Tax=Planktothrix serta PCC 8927 TaxID=671068 RepID=A0A7Z9BLQ6_9CYAN|nr:FIST N-terminal domain-containing protein [Planktothrix serta]VXD11126.1 conserved hypothetical protein [Planktothrix serta PCC 8927]
MKLETFFWKKPTGWSVANFPPLDSSQTLIIVFGAVQFQDDLEPLHALKDAYPQSHFIGCSTAGEIFGSTLMNNSLTVSVLQLQNTPLKTAFCPLQEQINPSNPLQEQQNSYQAGRFIAQELTDPQLKAVLILADGLQINGSEFLRGLNSILYQSSVFNPSEPLLIVGGLAADNHQFKRTWILENYLPRNGAVSAVGFYGNDIIISYGSQGGWTMFGPERQVTRSHHNILYELDHKPVLQLYQEYLGKYATNLPTSALFFPLALGTPSARKRTVRTVIGIDENTKSLIFTGDIPVGSVAQLMRGNYERLVDGALAAALITRNSNQRKMGELEQQKLNSNETMVLEPTLAIAISGSGRRLVLGERTEEELEATLDELPPGTQQMGFYSYGEIAPSGVASLCELHNQTMTLITIREKSS